MDYVVIAIAVVFVVVLLLFILGLFITIFKSDKKLESGKLNTLFWLSLGVLLVINLFG
ncbi:hypothetical protein [Sulfurimonas denitrificans]|uniref:hypothetical protein n=1 Tax=Sulfurimonas denitrificans TaxID=39766 RepID=UPI00130548EF|nr:hypothetical protein [Sulfurimonas denitrificans]